MRSALVLAPHVVVHMCEMSTGVILNVSEHVNPVCVECAVAEFRHDVTEILWRHRDELVVPCVRKDNCPPFTRVSLS